MGHGERGDQGNKTKTTGSKMGKEKRESKPTQPSLASFFSKKAGGGSAQTSPTRPRIGGNDAADARPAASPWRGPCCALLGGLLDEDEEGWFAAPVDAEELGLDDYFRVITEAMDLGTVQAKLGRGEYADPQAFARDVFLVFENACRYNESPDHLVHRTAAALARSFRKRFQAAFPPSEVQQAQAGGAAAAASAGVQGNGGNDQGKDEQEDEQEDDGSDVEILAASGAGCSTARATECGASAGKPTATRGPVHPFFAKRSQQQAQKEEEAARAAVAAAAAAASALAAEEALSRSSTSSNNSPERLTVAEGSSNNSGSSGGSSSSNSSSLKSQGGGAKKREVTDEELLSANDYFLNQAQSKRKAALLKAEADERERQERRQLLESFNKGKEIHPFFERPNAPSGGQGGGRGREGGAAEDEREWLAPLFPTVAHVTQEEEELRGQGMEEEKATHLGNVVVPRLTAVRACSASATAGGASGKEMVVDLDAEEAEEEASRGVMRWSESALVRRKDNLPLLTDAGSFEPWAARAQEAVEQLALAAGVYHLHQPAPLPPLLDHEALRRHMRWMKKQHDKAPAGTAAQWVDKYRPEEPNMLTWELQRVALQLQRWLESWQDWRAAAPGTQAKKKKQQQRKKKQQAEKDEEDEDDMDEGEPRSTTLITGPPGCGKTALVYATAAKLGFEVIEVNTSQLRSGAEVKKLFSEATQSQHISQAPSAASFAAALQAQALPAPPAPATKLGKRKKGGRGRPKKKAKDEEGEDDDEVILLEHILPRAGPSTGRMTLILIEEVDLVFDEDAGFHRALREFMLTAKWPLVLTANQAPFWLRESPACHIRHVEPCPTAELALLLGTIWAAEGLPALAPAAFTALARSFAGDVRSAIMNLQVWASRLPTMLQQQQQQQQHQAPPQLLPYSFLAPPSSPSSSSPSLALSLSPPAAAAAAKSPTRERDEENEEEGEGEEAVLEVSHPIHGAAAIAAAAAAADKAPIVFGYRCPVVKSVRPFSGRLVGGTRITIKGQHFLQPSDEAAGSWAPVAVLLGHMLCLDVMVLSDEEIKATTPPCPPSLSSAANGQFPVVVRVSRFASNEAARQLACHSSFRYQNKQRCIDELFPELRVFKHRLKRPVAALSDQQQEEEEDEGEGEEWDEGGMQQGREAKERGEGGQDSPKGRRSGSESEDGKGGQTKRRKVVLESDDEDEEADEEEGGKVGALALQLQEGGEEEGEEGREGGAPMTTPTTTGSMALRECDGSAQMVVDTTEDEMEEQEAKDGAAAAAIAAATIEAVVEEVEEEGDTGSVVPERVWREVLKPPCLEGQRQVDSAVLATLNEHAEALSCCDLLRAFAPGLDGDDYLQAPCSSLLQHGVTAQAQQDGEVSPWPQVPGAGDEIGNVLEALLARRERGVDVLLAARGPQRELSTSHEAAVAAVLRREKVMDVALPLLAPSFSLPYPTRRDVHLDYAPSLRAMQEADAIQNAGGRVSRRKKTYFTKVVEFVGVDEFKEGLACLARTGLASQN